MIKTAAIIFGVAFLLAGLLGFVPAAAPGGMLLGVLHINTAHNIVHLLTGAVALLCGLTSYAASRIFFQVFGIIYLLVALLGFVYGSQPILGLIANNIADAWFHLFVSAVSLYLGFFAARRGVPVAHT
jgi:hypothetical protein